MQNVLFIFCKLSTKINNILTKSDIVENKIANVKWKYNNQHKKNGIQSKFPMNIPRTKMKAIKNKF